MKIFIHSGKGHYIGSHVIVLAENQEQAFKMIREKLDEGGLKNEQIESLEIVEIDKPVVISFNNGDY